MTSTKEAVIDKETARVTERDLLGISERACRIADSMNLLQHLAGTEAGRECLRHLDDQMETHSSIQRRLVFSAAEDACHILEFLEDIQGMLGIDPFSPNFEQDPNKKYHIQIPSEYDPKPKVARISGGAA